MVTATALPLLQARTHPPKRRFDGLRCDRLVNALLEHSDRKLMLVIAPAGYGKASVLLDLIEAAWTGTRSEPAMLVRLKQRLPQGVWVVVEATDVRHAMETIECRAAHVECTPFRQ